MMCNTPARLAAADICNNSFWIH